MEKNAATVEDWAPSVFPGLLQTEAYARKLSATAMPWEEDEEIEAKVSARIGRAAFWKQQDRPAYWAILHEGLIRRPLVTPGEMAEQLDHIVDVIRASKSVVQILPETLVAHPLMMAMAKLLTTPPTGGRAATATVMAATASRWQTDSSGPPTGVRAPTATATAPTA
ncbi:DUF5753 domain-containing protein [Streptomyces sp. NPDC014733]|uniref:DUF5753 domain-containing protein n=1 Tax=Streptomyces sp. NPDC014733 TaxID=3364885 RepID=UPI0036FEBD7C